MESYNFLKYELRDNRVGVITLSRPEALNALNVELLQELDRLISEIGQDSSVKVLIITGEGKSFVAGADIGEMSQMDPHEARKFAEFGQKLFRKIETLEMPVIAAVNGYALGGGCELAMCCDIRIANEKAKFGQPEVGLGICPGFAGTKRLSRLVGESVAKELIFTGDTIDAIEALRIGLVNRVVSTDLLMDSTLEMANKIASRSNVAVKYSKSAINEGAGIDIDTASAIERDLFALCFASEDQKEGMTAFLEKRKPNFK